MRRGRLLRVQLALPPLRSPQQTLRVGIVARAIEVRLIHRRRGTRPQLDAVHRTGRDAKFAPGAAFHQHGMHEFCGTDDRIDRARRQASCAADAPRFIDPGNLRRALHAVGRIQGQRLFIQKPRKRVNGGAAARRTLIDLNLAAGYRNRIRTAARVAAPGALCLRKKCVDARHDIGHGFRIHVI